MRAGPVEAALEPAKRAAYPPGEYVGQESFMTGSEIRALVTLAGVGRADAVLEVCCGVGGPGRWVASETGCGYLGVDRDPVAVAAARAGAGPGCRFEVATVPPLPDGRFDVVLLLETLLAFRTKQPLVAAVAAGLRPGGRFVLTVEDGARLTPAERVAMPGSDTVWPVPLAALVDLLASFGLAVDAVVETTDDHRRVATALADAYDAERAAIGERIGPGAVADLVESHRLWAEWFRTGRVRKHGVVATLVDRG